MTKLISTTVLITAMAGSLIAVAAASKSELPSFERIKVSKPIIADQIWPDPKSGKPPALRVG